MDLLVFPGRQRRPGRLEGRDHRRRVGGPVHRRDDPDPRDCRPAPRARRRPAGPAGTSRRFPSEATGSSRRLPPPTSSRAPSAPAAGCAGTARTRLARIADRLASARRRRFVGREEEIEIFRSALQAGEPPFVALHITGAGGVGKTTLLQEYARVAHEAGRQVVRIDGRNIEASPLGIPRRAESGARRRPLRPGRGARTVAGWRRAARRHLRAAGAARRVAPRHAAPAASRTQSGRHRGTPRTGGRRGGPTSTGPH